ncbi:MAG: hypothetical protein AAF740_15195, partial [Bacteroidota bacterium]
MKLQNLILWTVTVFTFILVVQDIWRQVTSRSHQLEILKENIELWEAPLAAEDRQVKQRLSQFKQQVEENGCRPPEQKMLNNLYDVMNAVDSVFSLKTINQSLENTHLAIEKVNTTHAEDSIKSNLIRLQPPYIGIPKPFDFTQKRLQRIHANKLKEKATISYSCSITPLPCEFLTIFFHGLPENTFTQAGDSVCFKILFGDQAHDQRCHEVLFTSTLGTTSF